ncbi:hypothetical protein G4V62_16810 [Bacillaceae bacterium SIJ1]|uniref:CdaR family transcriptional regulator n=1 Tax=Litoribacterium kuwaitense TaxID=1398745 RepID=UPI0013EB84E1|nr:sugar diacid recognition domain-containing protein [Litoribacterium kuwaitense]NGP46526.1 hypothetical protein [Litoribacterium kuwaitense]
MNISTKVAQKIVVEMKEIIQQDINYINTEGVIIASTDLDRIGTFHGGGKRVIQSERNLMIRDNDIYKGSRKGINLPVYFENTIIGAIGITGDNKEVEKYGQIIKRMTEFIIKDAYINQVKNQEKEKQRMIIEELLFNDESHDHVFTNRLQIFNIQDGIPRMVIISEILDKNSMENKEVLYKIFNDAFDSISEHFILQNTSNIIMILRDESEDALKRKLAHITREVVEKIGVNIRFGIGTVVKYLRSVKDSFIKAQFSLGWANFSAEENYQFYSQLDIELITGHTPQEIAAEFCNKAFGQLSNEEIEEYSYIIHLFEKYNGSINQVSKALFIHKNTLQYKLNKLRDKTSYDMRKYHDFVVLKIAFILNSK